MLVNLSFNGSGLILSTFLKNYFHNQHWIESTHPHQKIPSKVRLNTRNPGPQFYQSSNTDPHFPINCAEKRINQTTFETMHPTDKILYRRQYTLSALVGNLIFKLRLLTLQKCGSRS